MRWMINLYPKKWRKRYGEEFLYILEKRKLSSKEIMDVFTNAMDMRVLSFAEGIRSMFQSVHSRNLILGAAITSGLSSGYWIAISTPSILELPPKIQLPIGAGLGIYLIYTAGFVREIWRLSRMTKKRFISRQADGNIR